MTNCPHSGEGRDVECGTPGIANNLDHEAEPMHSIGDLLYTDLLPYNKSAWTNTRTFLLSVVDILLDFLNTSYSRDSKVLEFHHPEQLMQIMDFKIPDGPQTLERLLLDCKEALHYQVKTGHPRYFNQISCGIDLVCMAGEWLTATANTNMFTYEIAPVFVLMEREVITRMVQLIGWKSGDGIFAPGGSISNVYAVNAARHHFFPRCKYLGASDIPKLVMFTSQDCHYSMKAAAAVTGIGIDMCISIPTDHRGRLIPSILERKIIEARAAGNFPFFVNATAGTTVYGAFDPISEIAEVCEKHHLWLHVDAAWGGGLLLSKKHSHLLAGIERAHSVTWNPHKLMGALLQCSVCLIKEDGLLFNCNQMSADYLFQQDKHYDVNFDTGDKAIQCGRHNDIFKLWLMWRAKGMSGFAKQIDTFMELAKYFVKQIKRTPGFEMVMEEPQFLNICYWFVPPSVRSIDDQREKQARLEKVASKIKGRMMDCGSTMVSYQPDPIKHRPNFFRLIISNQATTKEDLDFLISETVRLGDDL